MDWIVFILGLLPYTLEIYFLSFALRYKKPQPTDTIRKPFVSVHVPIHKEPPHIVINTLKSLSDQDYKSYEVLALVNNTPQIDLRKPIKDFCQEKSSILRYYHIQTSGYKGGTLNEAIHLSDPKTEIISVVDSDYQVSKDFIKKGVGFFEGNTAIVQFPQDYRDFPDTVFFKAMYISYRYFFAVIMRMCHVLGAVAFMGTVGFIRSDAIKKAGNWSEEVLTEDSEAGLRIVLRGFKGKYIDESIGKGLMPLSFFSCRQQRFRWAYGNAQTLIKHFFALTFGKELSFKQKIAFWIQNTVWHTPLIISLSLTFFSYLSYLFSHFGAGLLTGFLISRVYSFLWLYRKIDKLSIYESILGLIFYLSLFFPMSYAPMRVLIPSKVSFYRTPKIKQRESAKYFGEIFMLFLTFLLFLVSIKEGKWINVYTCTLSIIFFACFFWIVNKGRSSMLP
ncbi:MAG: glycosyltransferase family 2 protein [Hydrogenobacter sp.]